MMNLQLIVMHHKNLKENYIEILYSECDVLAKIDKLYHILHHCIEQK
jgi:hypothetical protein